MNRGTALKWAEAMEAETAIYDNSQLGFSGPYNRTFRSPLGVLATFFDPNGWTDHPLHLEVWHGEVFKLSAEWIKRGKIKTDSFAIYDIFDREVICTAEMILDFRSLCGLDGDEELSRILFGQAAAYVREHYEEL